MKSFFASAVLVLVALALLDDARAQGVMTQPLTGGTAPTTQTSTTQLKLGGSSKQQVQTFGLTSTVLLQCRRRAEAKGDRDFTVVAVDRSGAALSVGLGDSCADALRELLDQGMLIAGVTDLGLNTVLYTLVRS